MGTMHAWVWKYSCLEMRGQYGLIANVYTYTIVYKAYVWLGRVSCGDMVTHSHSTSVFDTLTLGIRFDRQSFGQDIGIFEKALEETRKRGDEAEREGMCLESCMANLFIYFFTCILLLSLVG